MRTYHLHIRGRVQGVGFRPHIYKIAVDEKLCGWVRNDTDGVHVVFNCDKRSTAHRIEERILKYKPEISIVQGHDCREIEFQQFERFTIAQSREDSPVKLLITPDLAICPSCSNELLNLQNRRHRYPFITCTQCGPRYSIINSLPYDRPYTTMDSFQMCGPCESEYNNILDKRHYSQTNSCADCPISLSLYDKEGKLMSTDSDDVLGNICSLIVDGNILAVKGIGGYMLMADATQAEVINELRNRKHRPAKPFAVMYPSLKTVKKDVYLNATAMRRLESPESPILLLPVRDNPKSGIAFEAVAPGLDALGVMMPYTGLYRLMMEKLQRPIIATSGNISDAPIIFRDGDAMDDLKDIADYIVSNDREVVIPQDDSVLRQCHIDDQYIVIRRSRGMAPSLCRHPFGDWENSVFAVGADLKSSFGIFHNGETYLSQYLGNLEYVGAQDSYRHTADNLGFLLKSKPQRVVSDLHPAYFSSQYAKEMVSGLKDAEVHAQPDKEIAHSMKPSIKGVSDSMKPESAGISHLQVQHHIAHFAANLGENGLLESDTPVLGVILDGTGYGLDHQIWGGEFFLFAKRRFERTGHLKYFEHKFGDKMVREPRLSAFALFHQFSESRALLKPKFTDPEWKIYTTIGKSKLNTSSLGRVFDGIASMLGLCDVMSFEGQAAIYLEQSARKYFKAHPEYMEVYPFEITDEGILDLDSCFKKICDDVINGDHSGEIACKFHFTICRIIEAYAMLLDVRSIAFSGGVFQNAFLVDSCRRLINDEMTLYFHKELSPNDENIAFGQLVLAYISDKESSYLKE